MNSAQDAAFVTAAAYTANFEVSAGELASARAYSDNVKAFGTKMVSDHNSAGARLATIAKPLGFGVPDLVDRPRQHILDAWSRLDGLVFDCSYVPSEYFHHLDALGLFADEAAHGDNADLVAFARQTLPTLVEHQRLISAALAALDCSGD